MTEWQKPLTMVEKYFLREHYLWKEKLKIIFLYTELTSLQKVSAESIVDYLIRAKNAANYTARRPIL